MIHKHQHFELLQKTILERFVFDPPFTANGTMHNEACFIYAVNGNSKVLGATVSEQLNTNEGVVMKCGNYLNNWLLNADDEPSEAVAVHFYPEVLQLVYEDKIPEFLKQSSQPATTSIEKVVIDDMIQKYVDSLIFYFDNPSLITEELIKLKVKELILLLVNTDSSGRMKAILQDLFNPTEYDFKETILANLFEDLSIENLATLTNLSVSSFKRQFKKVFGESPARFIKTKRLEKAAGLLAVSSRRITDICYDCGFNDVGHFSKSFTSEFGISPSEYRETQLN
jgi:AraC-like DNA-binding protein